MTQSVKDRMENMICEIENEVAFTKRYIGKDKLDDRVALHWQRQAGRQGHGCHEGGATS